VLQIIVTDLRRLGRPAEAADAYRTAIELAGTDSERRYLESRLTEVSDGVIT
jgi:RNA polymerase sigma-70 factor, ECF subfamily